MQISNSVTFMLAMVTHHDISVFLLHLQTQEEIISFFTHSPFLFSPLLLLNMGINMQMLNCKQTEHNSEGDSKCMSTQLFNNLI